MRLPEVACWETVLGEDAAEEEGQEMFLPILLWGVSQNITQAVGTSCHTLVRCLAPTAGAVPGTVCEASCVTRVRLLVHIAGAAVRLAPQSSVGGMPLVGAWHRSVRPEVAGRAGSLTCSEQEPVEREARRYRTPLASAERSTGNRSIERTKSIINC